MLSLVVILPMQTMACFIFDIHVNVCLMVMTSTNPDVRNTATGSRCFNRQCLFGFTLSSSCKFGTWSRLATPKSARFGSFGCVYGVPGYCTLNLVHFPDSNGTFGGAKPRPSLEEVPHLAGHLRIGRWGAGPTAGSGSKVETLARPNVSVIFGHWSQSDWNPQQHQVLGRGGFKVGVLVRKDTPYGICEHIYIYTHKQL